MNPATAEIPVARRRLKVCHLMHESSIYGGGATIALSYFPAYSAEFDTFALTGSEGGLAEKLRSRGVRTLTAPMKRPWRALFSIPRLIRILRREKPRVVVVHGQWGGCFGSIAARLAGIRHIVYVTHFPSFYTDWSMLKAVRNHLAEKITCLLSDRVICLSRAGRYQYLLRRLAEESKFVCIPNGAAPPDLSLAMDRAGLLRELNLPGDTPGSLVVSVSRLSDQKRIDVLVRAWALVEKEEGSGHLVIVGDGEEAAGLKELSVSLQLKRCHLIGPRPEGYRFFCAADFGVICSLFEGHPLSLIEAMFCGCAMIGTAVDGITETIQDGENGLLVPPADPAALAQAILRLMRQPDEARALAENARQMAFREYSVAHVIGRQFAVIDDLLRAEPVSAS